MGAMNQLMKAVINLSKAKYLLDENDYQQYKELFFYSFEDAPTAAKQEFLKREYERSAVYGIKQDGQLEVSVTCVPFKVNFFGNKIKMAGIANVMSAPEYLQNNGVTTLMNQAFSDMHQNGTALSYLGPFSFDYYRRFGYEQVFENLQITLPFSKLARYKKATMGHLRRFKYSEAVDVIGELFAQENTAGTVIRKPWWWKNVSLWSPDDLLAASYDELNELNGYLRYAFEDGNFVVRELNYQTPDAFLNLMHFINKHRSIYRQIIINSTDINMQVNNFVTNPLDAKVEIKPSMMARIVDLSQFFKDYPIQLQNLQTLYLEVNDSLTWNNHIWALSVKDGVVDLKVADYETPEVIVDIQTLTKAMFGYQTLSDSYLVGNVLGNSDRIKDLDALFIHEKAQLKDTF